MKDHIVIDVEIQKRIDEVPNGWNDTHLLGVSCAVVYEYIGDRFRIFGPNDIDNLKSRLERADRISGFNIYRFDYPVIYGLPGRERVVHLKNKTNDILQRIWRSLNLNDEEFSDLHKGWSLDIVCKGTLGYSKIGNGADAPKWYQNGELHRVINYCADDVALERDLTNFIDKYGFVVNNVTGQVLKIKD